jgi:hypothetical protein
MVRDQRAEVPRRRWTSESRSGEPDLHPIAKPGALHDYFRGNPEGKSPIEMLSEREPIRPEYRDRDARIKVLDEFGLEAVWLFPTLGVLY